MKDKKKLILAVSILGLSLAHFLASFFVSFAAGIGGNTALGSVLTVVSRILTFPLYLFDGKSGSDDTQTLLSWWPWALLSLTWGTALTFGLRRLL